MHKSLKVLLATVLVGITGFSLFSCDNKPVTPKPDNGGTVTPTPDKPQPDKPSTEQPQEAGFKVRQVNEGTVGQTVQLKALVVEVESFNTSKGTRFNVYITDKDGEAGALLHYLGENTNFVKGNYVQFTGKINDHVKNAKNNPQIKYTTRQVTEPTDIQVLETGVAAPQNLQVSSSKELSNVLNTHKIVDLVGVTYNEKKSFDFAGDKAGFTKFYDPTKSHTFTAGKKYTLKNVLITKDTKHAQIKFLSISTVEEVQ